MKQSPLDEATGRVMPVSVLWVAWLIVIAVALFLEVGLSIQAGRLASVHQWLCFALLVATAGAGVVLWWQDAHRLIQQQRRLETYRQMAQHAAVPLALTDMDGQLLFVNEAWSDRFGPAPRAADGALWDLGPIEADDPNAQDRIRKEGRLGGFAGPVQVRTAGGRQMRMHLAATTVRDRSHVPIGVAWVLTDIPEADGDTGQAQQLGEIVTHAAEAIICSDTEDRITAWNRAATDIFGYTAEEAIGQSIDILIPEDLRTSYHEAMKAKGSEAGILEDIDTVRQHKDGTKLPVHLTVANLQDKQGRITGRALTIRDISERRELEQQLRQRVHKASDDLKHRQWALQEADRRHQHLLEAVPHCVVIARGDGKVQQVNEAVSRDLGYTDKQVEVMRIGDFHDRDGVREINELMSQARREGTAGGYVEVRTNDGQHIEVEASVAFFPNLDCFQIIYRPPPE